MPVTVESKQHGNMYSGKHILVCCICTDFLWSCSPN